MRRDIGRDLHLPEPESRPCGPEASLADIVCKKNPDHTGFIPAGTFSEQHLPRRYRSTWRVELIKSLIPLTVHLSVGHVSRARPRLYPDFSDVRFPFSESRGFTQYRSGSGFVRWITKCGEGGTKETNKTCTCWECRDSEHPKRTWWHVGIATASHVVFDTSEVRDTEVRLFYDEKDSPRCVCQGDLCDGVSVHGDWCEFTVTLHQEDIGSALEAAVRHHSNLRNQALLKGSNWGKDLVVVISHPHGLPKYITIGKFVRMVDGRFSGDPYIYTTKTCPGSSGGTVVGGRWGSLGRVLLGSRCPHSEALPDGTNLCGGWWW